MKNIIKGLFKHLGLFKERKLTIVCKSWEEWIEKEQNLYNILKKGIKEIIDRDYIEMKDRGGLTMNQEDALTNLLTNELIIFTNNKHWVENFACENYMLATYSLFHSFKNSGTWDFIYDNLEEEELSDIVFENLKYQLVYHFEDVPEIKK